MSTPILATKLYIPSPQPKMVLRPRLIERLEEGVHRKLALISAPAGFSKTMLVSEWVAGCEHPVAWLSLDEEDSDPARFLTYFVAGLQTIDADLGNEILSAFQTPQSPPMKTAVASLLRNRARLPCVPWRGRSSPGGKPNSAVSPNASPTFSTCKQK